mmetsp:Transcript_40066/g.58567  ORF Transcript_40066/g.58567 Transcript_40066/m.58567 type:complete len:92 (-) Transcript_40066:929-1204(-)
MTFMMCSENDVKDNILPLCVVFLFFGPRKVHFVYNYQECVRCCEKLIENNDNELTQQLSPLFYVYVHSYNSIVHTWTLTGQGPPFPFWGES